VPPSKDDARVYNYAWRKVRREVLARDGHMCQIGGSKCSRVATEVDHIVPWRQGGALYEMGNLRAACKQCNAGRVARVRQRSGRPSREW